MADEPLDPGWSNVPPPDPAPPPVEPTVSLDPGWSNAPEDLGVSPLSAPPGGIDMDIPGWSNNGPPSTGATAGIPGAFTPALSDPPNALAAMTGITASPATAWTVGQYVKLGDGSLAHWSSTAWVVGAA